MDGVIMRKYKLLPVVIIAFSLCPFWRASAQDDGRIVFSDPKSRDLDTLAAEDLQLREHASGIDLMIGNDGFGVGLFYHRQFTDVLTAFANLSFSEVQDERLKEYTDPYFGGQYPINKLNRVFRIPLFFGVQYRLFKDEILDNFRPFVNAGAGPVMLYITPAVNSQGEDVEFFSSLVQGYVKYTYGGFAGLGAQFGFDRSSVFGLNIRYYVIPIPAGIRSVNEGELGSADGFFITLNLGAAF